MNHVALCVVFLLMATSASAQESTWRSCALDGVDFFYSVKDIYTGMTAEESGRKFSEVVAKMFEEKTIVEAYMSGHARIYACGQRARAANKPDTPPGFKTCIGTSSVRFFILDQIQKGEDFETIVSNTGDKYRDVVERLYRESQEGLFNATVLSSASHIGCVSRVASD